MYKFKIKVIETRIKELETCAPSAYEAQIVAEELDDIEFDTCAVVELNTSIQMVACDPKCTCEEDYDEEDEGRQIDGCDGFNNPCEICGSSAQDRNFVPNLPPCRGCENRCSACGACTKNI